MKFNERFQEQFARVEGPIKDLLSKLTRSQKLSLLVLGVSVLSLLGVMIFTSSKGSENVFRAPGTPLVREYLDANMIPYEDLNTMVEVESRYQQVVRSFMAANVAEDEDLMAYLYEDPSWAVTDARLEKQSADATRRMLENDIEGMDSVVRATVHIDRPKSSALMSKIASGSAGVMLETRGNVRLPARQVQGIQSLVAHAFSLPLEKVSISDGRGLLTGDETALIDDTESLKEQSMVAQIVAFLSLEFARSEFEVVVDLTLDRDVTTSNKIEYLEEGTVNPKKSELLEKEQSFLDTDAPGTRPNVARSNTQNAGLTHTRSSEENAFEPHVGEAREIKESKGGKITGGSVTVGLARAGIIEQLLARHEGEEGYEPKEIDIADFARALQQDLSQTFGSSDYQLRANVRVVNRVRSSGTTVSDDQVAMMSFFQIHGREIVLAFLCLIGCFFLYKAASRTVPQLEAMPDPVADLQRFLAEKEERDRVRALQMEEEQSDAPEPINWEASDEDREALELLKAVTDFASDRPELAATVLRNWLAEPNPKTPKSDQEEVK